MAGVKPAFFVMIKTHLTDDENTAILKCIIANPVITPVLLEGMLPWVRERGAKSASSILGRYRRYISGKLSDDDLRNGQPKQAVRYIRSLFQSLGEHNRCGGISLSPRRFAKTEGNKPRCTGSRGKAQRFDFSDYIREPLSLVEIFHYLKGKGFDLKRGYIRQERMPFGLYFSNDNKSNRNTNRPNNAGRIAILRGWYQHAGNLQSVVEGIANDKDIKMRLNDGAYVFRDFMCYYSTCDIDTDLETLAVLNKEFRRRCVLEDKRW